MVAAAVTVDLDKSVSDVYARPAKKKKKKAILIGSVLEPKSLFMAGLE